MIGWGMKWTFVFLPLKNQRRLAARKLPTFSRQLKEFSAVSRLGMSLPLPVPPTTGGTRKGSGERDGVPAKGLGLGGG